MRTLQLITVSLLAVCIAAACNSPLDVDTPRYRTIDGSAGEQITRIGVPVRIDFPNDTTRGDDSAAAPRFSTILVIDASGSMEGAANFEARLAAHAFLDSLDGTRDQAAVAWFNQSVTIYQHMTTHVPSLRSAVDELPASGGTALWDGVQKGLLELQSRAQHGIKALVVILEDKDNSSTTGTPQKILDLALRENIRIYSIALRESADASTLRQLADSSGGQHYQLANNAYMTPTMRSIVPKLRGW